jgi:hypothetical protein
MKKLKMFFVLLIGLFTFGSCQKDNPIPSSTLPKVAKTMDAMVVKTSFDWKTAIQYKFTLTAKSTHAVIFVTPSGGVNRKYFLIANNPFTVMLSIPAYEKTIHLLFNGKDVELPLSGSTLSYTFNY